MDYEQKYKEALERARELKNKLEKSCSLATPTAIESIFPELKENEDEIVIGALKSGIKVLESEYKIEGLGGINFKKILAWLEKQGDYNRLVEEIKERKELLSKEKEKATSSNDKLSLGGRIAMLEELLALTKEKQGEQKQKQYDIDVLEKHITKDSISELAHTVIVRNGWKIVDAKEQNSTWSEEDELNLK